MSRRDMITGKVPPMMGGCWFCHEDTGPLVFDCEFDTYLHLECLRKALLDSEDQEAEIMSYLLR